jgi:hypothetical protein
MSKRGLRDLRASPRYLCHDFVDFFPGTDIGLCFKVFAPGAEDA